MEFLEKTAGAEGENALASFMERCKKSWLGMMEDRKLVTFAQREERAVQEGRLLSRLLLEESLLREEAVSPGAHDQRACCPKCGRPGELVSKTQEHPPERAIKTLVGKVRFAREQWKCTTCRVVFFPDGREAGTGDGGLFPPGDPTGGA